MLQCFKFFRFLPIAITFSTPSDHFERRSFIIPEPSIPVAPNTANCIILPRIELKDKIFKIFSSINVRANFLKNLYKVNLYLKYGNKMVEQLKMYINGEWVDAENGETFDVISPANGQVLATLPKATVEDLKKAIDAAEDAKEKILSLSISERVKLAYKMAELIKPNIEQHAKELSLEQGKPIRESRAEVEDVNS